MEEEKNNVNVSISMNSMPIWVYKEFVKDINRYNGTYWIKLMSLMQKAEAFDMLCNPIEYDKKLEQIEPEKKEEPVKTMGRIGDD